VSRKNKPKEYKLTIESLSNEGRGIAHYEAKTVFVRGALVGEEVLAQRVRNKAKYDEADTIEVLKASSMRIEPKCEVFGICGGCSLQYLSPENQIIEKEQWLKNHFKQHGYIEPKKWLSPITSESWNYRRKARLGVRFVEKKGEVLVGFREKKSSFITQMDKCEVLDLALNTKIKDLKICFSQLSIKKNIPQIEVAITDEQTILILRHLEELNDNDKQILKDFAKVQNITWYLQSGGLDTVKPLENEVKLSYQHKKHNIEINFLPTDFTQVNFSINEKMLNQALDLLKVEKDDNILDLFCGLGNFSLPLAKYANSITGVDFDKNLIQRARDNAIKNGLNNIDFFAFDLTKEPTQQLWYQNKTYDKIVIDPARSGALEIIEFLPQFKTKMVLYVSCNPATLARDSEVLLKQDFELKYAGVMDMFPHTAHIESMALFIKK